MNDLPVGGRGGFCIEKITEVSGSVVLFSLVDGESGERPRVGSDPAFYGVAVRELSHRQRLLSSVAEINYSKYMSVRKVVAQHVSHVIERDTLLEASSISRQFGR